MRFNNYKTQQLHINPIKSQKQITKIHHPSPSPCSKGPKKTETPPWQEVKYSEFLAAMMSSRIEIHEDLVRTAFKRFDTDRGIPRHTAATGRATHPGHPLKDEVYGYNML